MEVIIPAGFVLLIFYICIIWGAYSRIKEWFERRSNDKDR